MYAEVALCLPFSRTFVYEIKEALCLPARVSVPFGKREIQGFVVALLDEKPEGLEVRQIIEVLDDSPLVRPDVFQLCRWISDYYMAPLGEVLKGALPPALNRKHLDRFVDQTSPPPILQEGLKLTRDQAEAIRETILGDGFKTVLLHGVTGSGKTEIYLRLVEHFHDSGKTALILVPEIGLTPQLRERFEKRFGSRLAVLHSSLTRKERINEWLRIYNNKASIVIGTRSALFAPLQNLGVIVVDEEHESSFKQEEMPRYHARDSAIMRAKMAGAVVVLGSATPSMESFRNAELHKYTYVQLPERVAERSLPEVEIINMREEFARQGRQTVFCGRLIDALEDRINRGEQAMILLNRRGYSMFLLCRKCGYSFSCDFCSVSMTYHRSIDRLLCHYCGNSRKPEITCPECSSEYVHYVGEGTQQIEERLQERLNGARIGRIDRDTMRHLRDYDRLLSEFRSGRLNVLVGTQMIAKGHDFPMVTLVGVIAADAALSLPDFRASERTFQLLTQVAGRSGRGENPGKVIIQSYFPDHYSLQLTSTHRFEDFYAREVNFRRAMFYPPFAFLASVLVKASNRGKAKSFADEINGVLLSLKSGSMRILGPAPAPIEKLNRYYRQQLLIKSSSRSELHNALVHLQAYLDDQKTAPTRVTIDVDPVSLM